MLTHRRRKVLFTVLLAGTGVYLMQVAACLTAGTDILLSSINRAAIFNVATTGIFQPCLFFACE